jgi:GH15 family glucan-1,4-alpha-glucosidase
MCWAAVDRMAAIAARHRPEAAAELRTAADRIHAELLDEAWSEARGSFVSSYRGTDLDAALLQLPILRVLPPDDARLTRTVELVRRELGIGGWVKRYETDPMGRAEVAFTICTFWLVEALARVGDRLGASELLARVVDSLAPLGLVSEDYDPLTRRMWGNFPQGYSHVGLIHAAFAASPPWSDIV